MALVTTAYDMPVLEWLISVCMKLCAIELRGIFPLNWRTWWRICHAFKVTSGDDVMREVVGSGTRFASFFNYACDLNEKRILMRNSHPMARNIQSDKTFTVGLQELAYNRSGAYTQEANSQTGHGKYAGRGPKGYKRADEAIKDEVCSDLTAHPEIDASEIEVKVENGIVTLSGFVIERRMKRLAEESAENVRGVQDVRNEIQIQKNESNFENNQQSRAP